MAKNNARLQSIEERLNVLENNLFETGEKIKMMNEMMYLIRQNMENITTMIQMKQMTHMTQMTQMGHNNEIQKNHQSEVSVSMTEQEETMKTPTHVIDLTASHKNKTIMSQTNQKHCPQMITRRIF